MAGVINVFSDNRRAALLRVRQNLAFHNPGVDLDKAFTIYPDNIIVVQQVTSRTEYRFLIHEQSQNADNPYERKLSRNDAFYVSQISQLLALVDTSTVFNLSNAILTAFPDPAVFAGVGESQSLEAFYNASFTLKTSVNERIKSFDTNLLRFSPQENVDQWGPSMQERGFYRLGGEEILDGSQDNEIVLSLNRDADIAAAIGIANQETYIVYKLHGHRVAQGARRVGKYM